MSTAPFIGSLANGKRVTIDVPRLLRSRMLITAMSGGGKSWTLRRLLEQTHGQVQQIVIDPEGEFYTLRDRYDYLLCGPEGEVPAETRSASMLARKILETGVSAIVDLDTMYRTEKQAFVRNFIEGLMRAKARKSRGALVVLDEAHTFAPQSGSSESLNAVALLASAGRKRGLAPIVATQRLAKLHKDVAAEMGSILVGMSKLQIDVRLACDLLGFPGKSDQARIRNLNPDGGEFFFMGPAFVAPDKTGEMLVCVGPVKTKHPEPGEAAPPPAKTSKSIARIVESLADLPKAAAIEAVEIGEANDRIRELNRDLKKAKSEHPIDTGQLDEAFRKGLKQGEAIGRRDGWISGQEEMKQRFDDVVTNEIRDISEAQARAYEGMLGLDLKVNEPETTGEVSPSANGETGRPCNPTSDESKASRRDANEKIGADVLTAPDRSSSPKGSSPQRQSTGGTAEQRILNAMGWLASLKIESPWPRTQVAFVAGFRPNGHYRNILSKARTAGLIEYPETGMLCFTSEGGRQAIVPTDSQPHEIRDRALRLCNSAMERILRQCMEEWPNALGRDVCAERCEMQLNGHFRNLVSKLKTTGLIAYPRTGFIRAENILFPGDER